MSLSLLLRVKRVVGLAVTALVLLVASPAFAAQGLTEALTRLAGAIKPLVFVVRLLTSLSHRWRRNSDRRAQLPRLIYFIVSRRNRHDYRDLRRIFGKAPGVEVLYDRRLAERRHRTTHPRVERRRGERRVSNVDGSLLRLGWAIAAAKTNQ